MKIGIYITGLGQTFVNETVENCAERLMNEISFQDTGIQYELKSENIIFFKSKSSTVVSIVEKGNNNVIYKIYDFKYEEILTEKFNNFPLILKSVWLFLLVIRKFPSLFGKLFNPNGFSHPFQAFYLLFIFLLISIAFILLLPVIIESLFFQNSNFIDDLINFKSNLFEYDIPCVSIYKIVSFLDSISNVIISFFAIFLLFFPNFNTLISNLATEFVCANDYLEYGIQSQRIQGNLEHLIEYISENECQCEIHIHAYSFGSIIAMDYLFPYGSKISVNTRSFCKGLISIGNPYEFVKSVYPRFFDGRLEQLKNDFFWINIYSSADPLASNFRNDSKIWESEYGLKL